jgi:hypothetical protein
MQVMLQTIKGTIKAFNIYIYNRYYHARNLEKRTT